MNKKPKNQPIELKILEPTIKPSNEPKQKNLIKTIKKTEKVEKQEENQPQNQTLKKVPIFNSELPLENFFYSPRERTAPQDIETVLKTESQRYWSPNHAKWKSNEYFLSKRQQKLKKDQGIIEENDEKPLEISDSEGDLQKNCYNKGGSRGGSEEKKITSQEWLVLEQMKGNEKNLKFQPLLKGKEQEEVGKNIKNIKNKKKNIGKNDCFSKEEEKINQKSNKGKKEDFLQKESNKTKNFKTIKGFFI